MEQCLRTRKTATPVATQYIDIIVNYAILLITAPHLDSGSREVFLLV